MSRCDPNCRANCRGFTLLEMIIVMVIIAVIAGIGMPKFLGSMEKARVKTTAGKIAAAMRGARSFAVEHKKPVSLVIDSVNKKVFPVLGMYEPGGKQAKLAPPVEIPNEVRIWTGSEDTLSIEFSPRGISTGGEIFVTPGDSTSADDEEGYSVKVDPLSGRARVTASNKVKEFR